MPIARSVPNTEITKGVGIPCWLMQLHVPLCIGLGTTPRIDLEL